VGAGLIVYFLEEPFKSYAPGESCKQWYELLRDRDNVWYVEAVYQVAEGVVRFVADPLDRHKGVYDLDVVKRAVARVI